ncbi:hypothetical protein F0562_013858 [Nyssa sinensis]|uniref:Uncharacterized protein n=1 Tax=Nyssa sinensis TaxID=561372 RepID=A0A5J4ZRB2_9ASTE|nr:hypothetical protein F0562_013858 [Nyssa sinensis]
MECWCCCRRQAPLRPRQSNLRFKTSKPGLEHKFSQTVLMAESQKGASSSVKSGEKTSLMDLEIGKDFLSSWKSMSVAENDTMDFEFETVAKGKKKTFNFDKLDMDFSLDGDFDKISSFKVDISDLDISSPPKKAGKPKEKSKEESAGGNNQGKQDRFTFPFDFSELDNFSFEPSLMREEKKSNKNVSEGASNRSECKGSEVCPTEDIGALEDDVTTAKLPGSGGVISSKIETMVNGHGDFGSINENSCSKSVTNVNCPSKSATLGNMVASQGARTSPEETSTSATLGNLVASQGAGTSPEKTSTSYTQEKHGESQQPEKTKSSEPYAQETIHDFPIQSVSGKESTQGIASELHGEVSSLATKVSTSSGGEQNANVKLIAGLGSNCENSPLENSPPRHMARSSSINGERNKLGSDNHVQTGNIDGAEPAQGDSDFEDASITSVSTELLHDTKTIQENQNSTSKLLLAPGSSGTTVDKLMPMKEKEAGVIRSRFFKRSDESESQSQQALSTQTKLTSFGNKRIGMQLSPIDERRRENIGAKDEQSGSKFTSVSRSHSGDQNKGEPVQLGSGKSVKGLKSIGGHFNVDVAPNGSKLICSSMPQDQEVTKGEPVLRGSEKITKNLNIFSSHPNPSGSAEQTNKSVTQNCINPIFPVSSTASIKNLSDSCIKGNKISPFKSGSRKPDLYSLKTLRTIGASHNSSNSTSQKEIKFLRNTERNMELQGNTAYKMVHSVGTEKRTPPTPSLKRKTFEASNADMLNFNPSKRLSESPTESRNSREPSDRVVDKQVFNHVNLADGNTKNVFNDCQTSVHDIPQEVNMAELEIHLVMENDGNVEKAEACTKELEDICSMLKKKHEEAKELLVRAIVNNNNLLMLNHPIYEEKICMIQKFSSQLMSKELHT